MRRPNFILFVTDQQRADHLGCYGNPIVRTPNIDSIAAQGTRFDKFYVACPVCMPNRASLMTGRLPSQHMVRHNGIPLPRQATTFVDVLRTSGYRTGLVGKGHLQNMTGIPAAERSLENKRHAGQPSDGLDLGLDDAWYEGEAATVWRDNPDHDIQTPFYGFDHVRACSLHGDQVEGHYTKWLRDRRNDWDQLTGPENAIPDGRYSAPQAWRTRVPEDLYPTSYVAEEAINFLGQSANDDDPFFLMVSFPDPHHPFTPPGKYWDMYDPDEIPVPRNFDDKLWDPMPDVPELREALTDSKNNPFVPHSVTERQAREVTALSYGMISMVDDAIGTVLDTLQKMGLADDTVVGFTSDHGDYLGDRGAIFKFGMHYQEIIRVACLWKDPKKLTSGDVSSRLAGTIDLAPTVLSRAGLNPYFGIQGLDLFDPLKTHAGMLVEDYAIAYLRDASSRAHFVSYLTDDARLSRYESSGWGELYNLLEDPDERINLWDANSAEKMKAKLHEDFVHELIAKHDRSVSPTGRG